jgi:mannan endo-1,4-beta-mannosidase
MIKSSIALLTLAVGALASPLRCRDEPITFEAEDGDLNLNSVLTEVAGFTGTGYVGRFEDGAGSSVRFTVPNELSTAALYDVSIRYAGLFGDKYTRLVLNDGASSEVQLPATESWESVSAGQILLNPGDNTIDIVGHWGWYLVDSITIQPSAPRPPHNIADSLVNPNANADANALYDYLNSIYGEKILSGQQDLKWADYIEEQTGKVPALVSVDLMDYSPSRVEYQGDISTAVEEGLEHAARGGIISVLWHWNAPTGLYDTAENPWWSGFYTRATDFNVATALADTTNANYTLIIRDIDAIAKQLKRFQDANVPVLWRVLHEAEGGWFWWGAQGPEPAKKLWDLVYDRLTNHHGLNNIIWVWNSIAADWYPGDDTVDILSADVYATGNGPLSTQYNSLVELGKDTKLIAASEVGSIPDPDLLIAYDVHWLWFAAWGDTFINNPEYNSPELLKKAFNHPYVLTLDEIQGWKD